MLLFCLNGGDLGTEQGELVVGRPLKFNVIKWDKCVLLLPCIYCFNFFLCLLALSVLLSAIIFHLERSEVIKDMNLCALGTINLALSCGSFALSDRLRNGAIYFLEG